MAKNREACGRCSSSVAVEISNMDRDGDERSDRDPYGTDRIEVDEDQLRTLSPDGWLSRVSTRLDGAVQRFTWGR